MSEAEIKRRQEYKRNRKKWTVLQIIAIILIGVIALGSFLIYDRMNRTYYIEYTENSNIDYKVQYKENDFFEEEWLDDGQAYIASLIDNIIADFTYELDMDASNVGFDYTYSIDATLLVADKDSGNAYYEVNEVLIPERKKTAERSRGVAIAEQVAIDYVKYNKIATSFVNTYGLKNASSTLIVTLNVSVLSSCEDFEENNQNTYATSINIPLAAETFSVQITSSVPESESKVLAYKGSVNQTIFLVVSIVAAVLALILVIVLIVYLQVTRNEDITYTARIRKLLRSYGSFIQRIDGEFDDTGYQVLMIKTFNEMLGIRDTIQSPVLMSENKDETMTRFLIPTNTKILYVYEIKVDNYDEIYGLHEEPEEEPLILANVDEEELAEALAQPDVVLADIEYEQDDDDKFEAAPDEPGVEVVGVVWPERQHRNKVYRYDPNGEVLHEGDVILVPTMDVARNREVIRKVAVAHGNHRVEPEHIKHPLKKVIGIIKRCAEDTPATETASGEE